MPVDNHLGASAHEAPEITLKDDVGDSGGARIPDDRHASAERHLQTLEGSYDRGDLQAGRKAVAALRDRRDGQRRLWGALTADGQLRFARAELLVGVRSGQFQWGKLEERVAERIITQCVKEGMLGEVARTALLLGQVVPDQAIADKWLGRAHQAATQIGDRQLQGRARLSQAALRAASTGDLQAPGETVAKYLAEAGKLLDQAGDPLADSVREWKPGQAVPDRPLELSNPQRESSG